jgi:hypothetical protein
VNCQHIAFHRQVDRRRIASGQIEQDDELVALAVGVDRNRRRASRRAEHLLGDPIELTERIGTHQRMHG